MKKNLLFLFVILCTSKMFGAGLTDLITEAQFNTMFPNRNAYAGHSDFTTNPTNKALFSYTNLVNASSAFPLFCNEGTLDQRKRELAAFLANTSHETTGGWGGYVPTASDYVGRYTWGYCFPRELECRPTKEDLRYTSTSSVDYPPVNGQYYYGRGPIQLSWNYNYGAFSQEILGDKNILLSNAEKVLEDGTIFYQSAVWFWMTPETSWWGSIYKKPSCHDVMVNAWSPTDPQKNTYKVTAGFPVTINIINGGLESGTTRSNQHGPDDRLGFYLRYCEILGVDPIDTEWGYSASYSFSTWNMDSEIHKQLNSYYAYSFNDQQRTTGTSSIVGYVKDAAGNGISRCHILLYRGTTYYDQAITDANGKYELKYLPNDTYNIVASKTGFTFTPASNSTVVSGATTATTIIGSDPKSIKLSGVVATSTGVGVKDVVVNLVGTNNYSATTDADGKYTIYPVAGTYTLSFTKTSYTFSSNNASVTVAAGSTLTRNSTASYTGTFYAISGNIKKADGTTAFSGVTVALSGGKTASTTTDVNGNYSFSSLEQNLSYTVTPSISGAIFTAQTLANLTSNSTLNFTAQLPTGVSGTVLVDGSALSGVTIKISNRADSVMTDASGKYSTPVLSNGGTYMITPRKEGYVFDPAYKYYSSINKGEVANFTAKAVSGSPKKRIIYYYPDWATYGRNFQVKDIDTRYLTNVLFAFVMPFYVDGTKKVDDDVPYRSGKNGKILTVENITVDGVAKSVGLAVVDDFADIQKFPSGGIDLESGTGTGGTYISTCAEWLNSTYKIKGGLGQMVQLRKKVKNETGRDIQIQISIGGWTLAQAFPAIADNQLASDAFGRACKTFLDKSTYDGVDIDWEFPVDGGTDGTETIDGGAVPAQPHKVNDAINFTRLMKSIRSAIGTNKLLTMASAQNPSNVLTKYVFPGTMSKFGVTDNCLNYLDYIQTMSYDYGGYWCGVATHECPLYNSNDSRDENKGMSASMLIDTLLSAKGGNVPPSKLVMGLPFYGKIFGGVADGGTHGLYQTNPKSGRMPGSWDPANISANEASTSIDFGDLKDGKALTAHKYLNNPSSGFTEYWDDVVKCPYLYNPTTKVFVTYDDQNSLADKVKFLNNRYLLGAMVWEVTQDTKDGVLMKAVYNNIQQSQLKIDGVIKDKDGNGITGVTVALSGNSSQTVTTGSSGAFSFSNLEPGKNYSITLSKSSMVFLDASYSFTSLSESKSLTILGSSSSYTISGKTTLADGTLLANSVVSIYKGTDLIKSITSTDGNYSFTSVPGGFDYTIKATKASYQNNTGNISLTSLSSNKADQNFKFSMQQFKICGYVKASTIPVSGVSVTLTGSSTATLTTNSSGFFQTGLLDAVGSYTITPSKSNAVFSPSNYSYTNLSKNDTVSFSITEETMLYGYVKDGTTPVAGVKVRITPSWIGGSTWDSYNNQSVKTDATGYYEFRNGPTSVASLSVVCNNEWDKLSAYSFRATGDTVWTNFTGAHRLDWNTQSSSFTVSGSVKDGSGNPIANVVVQLYSGTTLLTTVKTDATGKYSANVAKNTACIVKVALTNYTFTVSSKDLGTVTGNVSADFTGTFSGQYYSISGTVKKSDNSAFSGVTVTLTGGATKTATTASDGTYSFTNLTSGQDYVLKASYSDTPFAPDSIKLSTLSANSTANIFTEKPKVYYTVSGTIKKADGTTVSDVTLTLEGNGQTLTTLTNASGSYTFSNVLGGKNYTLKPSATGKTFTPDTKTISGLSANTVTDFVLVDGVYIYGYVKNGTTPVAGAKVDIVLQWTSGTAGYQNIKATTDATGYYQYTLTGDYIGGNGGSVKMNSWENSSTIYYPTDGFTYSTFSAPMKCNFNSQQNSITVSGLSSASVTTTVGSAVQLQADAYILSGNVQSVSFVIDNQTINAVLKSGNTWVATWIPSTVDQAFDFTVTAKGEGITGTAKGSIMVNCGGTNCPNKVPVISNITPSVSLEQQATFKAITFGATVTDPDGSVSNVSIAVDGTKLTTVSSGSNYTASFTPSEYKKYTIVITATDNSGATTSATKEYTVRVPSAFTPIPDWVVVGYHHTTFSNGTYGTQTLADLVTSKYNSINCSFIETTDGYIPKFEVTTSSQGAGPYNNNTAQMKADIKKLKAAGKPVLVSIGGANGHIELSTPAQRDIFVEGIKAIVEEYGFDGIDLDFEGGTMAYTFPNNKWTYDEATYPKLTYLIQAIRSISSYFGSDFIITAAPETQYVQGATSAYSTGWGSFLIVVENIRDILDYIHVQLYNTGSQSGADGKSYAQGSPNFVVAMTDMLVHGFNTTTGLAFKALRPDQVAIGLPSCPSAAPSGGYMAPAKVIEALDYLRTGTKGSDITYTLQGGPYPTLRGVMTWSTNWDASVNFEFSNNYYDYYYNTVVSPTVTTQAVTSVTANGAVGNATISVLGTPAATSYGVCWSTASSPTISNSKIDKGTATAMGAFTVNLTDLTPNTKYYVRAFATNTKGTVYGEEVNFTTSTSSSYSSVTTGSISSIGASSASVGGTLTALGSPAASAYGICWSTTSGPTISNNKTDNGAATATGAFTANLTGLIPNTKYYVRAYATNASATVYGTEVSFTTSAISPTVTTQAVSTIGFNTATANATLTVLGNPSATAYGICWNTISGPTVSNSKIDKGVALTTGSYTASMTGLTPNTTYYVRAYATSLAGTVYGSEVSFTTANITLPSLTTESVSGIGTKAAIANGTLTGLGSPAATSYGVCWATTSAPTTSNSKVDKGAANSIGSFSVNMTGLTPNTKYYVRTYATNSGGTAYGSEVSFTTNVVLPTVTTEPVSGIGTITATGNGTLSELGSPAASAYGLCWSTTSNPTISNSKSNKGAATSTGSFVVVMTDLIPNAKYYVRAYATSTSGTVYGDEVSFTTGTSLPVVTTESVSNVGASSANVNGVLMELGAPYASAYGICWSTTSSPTIDKNKVDNGSATVTGAFEGSLTGLTPNTTYYARAYATNSAGTVYGKEVSFTTAVLTPVVTTQSVTGVGIYSATANGNLTGLGTPAASSYGICWSTTSEPTISSSKIEKGAASTTGAFVASLTGLTPNTTYYVRAYATNSEGTVYGSEVSFTTSGLVLSVSSEAVTNIGITSAVGNGILTGLGSPSPSAYGICWSTTSGPTIANSKTDKGVATATGAFSSNMTGLTPNTKYYVRAYATNVGGTVYGSEVSFTTSALVLSVTTEAVSSISSNRAIGNGTLTGLGSPSATSYGICWSLVSGPTIADNQTDIGAATATGSFSVYMNGLTPNTKYYVRAYATNSGGTVYGTEVNFTTSSILPSVTTDAVSGIGNNTATGNGTLISRGTPSASSYGICWATTSSPTIANSKTDKGAAISEGVFTAILTNLTPNTKYYVRAYATSEGITVYGTEVSFTTALLSPEVTTQAVSGIGINSAIGNGTLTTLGVPAASSYGICWSTTSAPTTANSKVEKGSATATGAFSATITGLTPNTTYYVRAYATNARGTVYGSEVTFVTNSILPAVTTQAVSAVGLTSATGNGTLTGLGTPSASAYGFCWGTTSSPTISNSKISKGVATSLGAFTANLMGLTPNTTYYVRAFATNAGGTVYGTEVSFTTETLPPAVTTQAVSAIGASTATGNGTLTGLGTPTATAYGVCWSTTSGPTISNSKTEKLAPTEVGTFTAEMSGLTPNTTYYVRAYATNGGGTVYGAEVSFKSGVVSPEVTTQAVTNVGVNSATGNGTLINLGSPTASSYGVCWSTTSGPTINNSKVDKGAAISVGTFVANLSSLTPNTKYYVRSFATSTTGTVYGSEVSFTTESQLPTLKTDSIGGISSTTVIAYGSLTSLGIPAASSYGFCWGPTSSPTISNSKFDKGAATSTGSFTSSLTGLTPNKIYYVRAYATNSGGTVYGSELMFVTSSGANDIVMASGYPNPITDKLSVEVKGSIQGELVVGLYDNRGKLVISKTGSDTKMDLNTMALLPGIYVIKVSDATRVIQSFRIIKR